MSSWSWWSKIYTKKREGDKATPIGKWKLKSIYYRSDKILKPIIKKLKHLKLIKLLKIVVGVMIQIVIIITNSLI